MTKKDFLELNKKIVSSSDLSAYYPFPNGEVPYSIWTLYKMARKMKGLLDDSMITITDSIYFSKDNPESIMTLDDKFYLSYVLRPYLVSLLKLNKDYREVILKEKVSSFLSKYDYSGTLATSISTLNKNIEENNDARILLKENETNYVQKLKFAKKKKEQQLILCQNICSYLLENSDRSSSLSNPYITIYKKFLHFYIQALKKYDNSNSFQKTDEDYKVQIKQEINQYYKKDIFRVFNEQKNRKDKENNDAIIQKYLCTLLRNLLLFMNFVL